MKRRVIVILGMHRSGTSAMAGIVNLLGVDLGAQLLRPSKDNVRGFWEHAEIMVMNEWALRALGSSWSDFRPLPVEWWHCEYIRPIQGALLRIVRRDFGESLLSAMKDPRFCRVLPMWYAIFEELRYEPLHIIMVRNPKEVADSLLVRDGITPRDAYLLWLEYMLAAERSTRGKNRVFIRYSQLVNHWETVLSHIEQRFCLSWPKDVGAVSVAIESFISPSLRHHMAGDEVMGWNTSVSDKILHLVGKTYHFLVRTSNGSDIDWTNEFTSIHDEFARIIREERQLSMEGEIPESLEKKHEARARTVADSILATDKYVQVVFPAETSLAALQNCIDTLYEKISDSSSALFVVDNRSEDPSMRSYLVRLAKEKRVSLIRLGKQGQFRTAINDRPELRHAYICMANVDVEQGFFRELTQYGELSCFWDAYGPNMVVTFGRQYAQ